MWIRDSRSAIQDQGLVISDSRRWMAIQISDVDKRFAISNPGSGIGDERFPQRSTLLMLTRLASPAPIGSDSVVSAGDPASCPTSRPSTVTV